MFKKNDEFVSFPAHMHLHNFGITFVFQSILHVYYLIHILFTCMRETGELQNVATEISYKNKECRIIKIDDFDYRLIEIDL